MIPRFGRRGLRTTALVVLLALPACGGADEGWGGTISTVDGVTTITSPGTPLARPDEVTVTELWSYAGPAEGDVWGVPRHLGVSGSHAFVVDDQADQIHVVTLDGRSAGSLGGPGQGPGEYTRPVAAVATDDGTFIVDGRNRRIDIIDDGLDLVRSFDAGTIAFSALPWGPASIVVQGMVDGEPGWTSWNASGEGEQVTLEALRGEDPDGSGCYVVGSTTDRVLRLDCARFELSVYSHDGELEREVRVEIPPVTATDEEVEERVRQLRETLSQTALPASFMEQQVAAIRDGDRAKNIFRKVTASPEEGLIAVWSQNPEDYGSGPASLHLLDENGVYLATLDFSRPWNDFAIGDGVLYSLEEDESTGLVSLVARRMDVAESLVERAASLMR